MRSLPLSSPLQKELEMEEKNKELRSIWGKWWEPIRKWFYPAWLIYEVSIRFNDYGNAVHTYFLNRQPQLEAYIGQLGAQSLASFCSIATFTVCTLFLTLPACLILYKFFKVINLTGNPLEERFKTIF